MAVSSIHEGLLELVRDRPAFAADLLTGVLDVRIPPFAEARIADSTLNQATPVENHADAAVLLIEGDPVLGVIVEAQLQEDARKHYTWPLYAIAARARHECPFIVLVVTLDTQVALWASRPIDLGDGMMFRPRVIGPDAIPKLTDADHGKYDPQLAVLSAIAHGRGDLDTAVQIGRVAYGAVSTLSDDNQRLLYSALITRSLSDAAREVLAVHPLLKPLLQELKLPSYSQGLAEGEARGEAKALLTILAERGLLLTEAQRRRVVECADLATLDHWLKRALSVASADELLVP